MAKILNKLQNPIGVEGPVLTIVMDGVGIAPDTVGNAVKQAYTPTLDMIMDKYKTVSLKAHGTAVGLPTDDDMGNSEVGHNALGSGQVFAQGAKLVSESIENGKMFASSTWQNIVKNVKDNSGTLHFIGLFSDGNVHSHIDHLKAMIVRAKEENVSRVRLHILIDGRDVGETSSASRKLQQKSSILLFHSNVSLFGSQLPQMSGHTSDVPVNGHVVII